MPSAKLKDEMPEVRVLSATALGQVAQGDEQAIEGLGLALSGDPDVDVRSMTAAALEWMGTAGRGRGLDPAIERP